jgi:hypothetical protein
MEKTTRKRMCERPDIASHFLNKDKKCSWQSLFEKCLVFLQFINNYDKNAKVLI